MTGFLTHLEDVNQGGRAVVRDMPYYVDRQFRLAAICRVWIVWLCFATYGLTQDAAPRLIDQEPFDVVVLKEQFAQEEGVELRTLPLDLPNRKIPENPPANDWLRARLVSDPDTDLEIKWNAIERIELFEQRVLREAERLISRRKFDEAFEIITYLRDHYPKLAGLPAANESLLTTEAAALYQAKQFERAWLLLDEAYTRNRERKGLTTALDRVLEAMFQNDISLGDYREARRRLGLVRVKYGEALNTTSTRWQQRFDELAVVELATTRSHLEKQAWRDAYLASRRLLELAPDSPECREVAAEAERRYPLLRVGTCEPLATGTTSGRSDWRWSARGTLRLRCRMFCEASGVSSEGVTYASPCGTLTLGDDLRSLSCKVQSLSQPLTLRSDAFRWWRDLADQNVSSFSPPWGALVERLEPRDAREIVAQFRHPHLRPQSLLELPFAGSTSAATWQPYVPGETTPTTRRWLINPEYRFREPDQLMEIEEQVYATPREAVQAMRHGRIDFVDRVFPADVPVLRRDPEVVVIPHRVPSMHVLVANPERTYPNHRLFRRALLYAVDRERILHQHLLANATLEGCRVVSGPFSAGLASDDPLAYAYDEGIAPRAYDARHAQLLLRLAEAEIAAAAHKSQTEVPLLGEITLVHPDHEMARVACQEIVADWRTIGVSCVLRVENPSESDATSSEWDFRYVDYVMPEPLVQAAWLLGTDGLAHSTSPHVEMALLTLDRIASWNDAGDRLRQLHQLCFDDTTVLPLYQLHDHAAHRLGIVHVPSPIMQSYQAVEAWRLQTKEPTHGP